MAQSQSRPTDNPLPVRSPAVEPSNREKIAIATAKERHNQRPPRVTINIKQSKSGPAEISPTHSDEVGWQTRLKDALGTSSYDFLDTELARLLTVFRDPEGRIDPVAVNGALAVVDGLKPQNEAEAMLTLQIVVTHGLAMKFSARLYGGKITIPQQRLGCFDSVSAAAGVHNAT